MQTRDVQHNRVSHLYAIIVNDITALSISSPLICYVCSVARIFCRSPHCMFSVLHMDCFSLIEAFNFGDRQGASASGMAPYQPFLQQVPNLLGNPQFPQAGSTQYHIPQQQQQQTALQTSLQVSLF
ncbi:unnamed protein product [Brugia timori]|uniref:Clathrin assembly protein n=1 Tax=Brugia timori TaxID=42155 RepID=A0A0R3QEH3_9BILA|nr:unnamed protein product [Brugia timori]